MGPDTLPGSGAYVEQLADHARQLQREARRALEQGDYAHATALFDDAELLAGDVHMLVCDLERREICSLMTLAAYDVREAALPPPPRERMRLTLPSRRLRVALGTSLAMSLVLTEW
jgi:hypothetical protein